MNQVALIGRITRNLTLRTTANGKPYVFFSVAVNESKDRTDFINCVAWNKVAENMAKFTGKGSLISIVGKISTRKDNNDQYITEVLANSVTFLDNKRKDNSYEINEENNKPKLENDVKKVNIDEAFDNDLDTEINFINNDNLKNSNNVDLDDDEAIIWD